MISEKFKTPIGEIPKVSTKLTFIDYFGAIKVRWLINRNHYSIKPGLYAIGTPDECSDVFVSANYKLSFDHLRKNLCCINAYILVLDTKGVNVWCAAGKGTFGTQELINKTHDFQLKKIINHKRIIVPQLGATGISAHQVKQNTREKGDAGFNVVWGPIKASDIKGFIANNYTATERMRRVTFSLKDRLILLPVDIVYSLKKLAIAFLFMFLISGLSNDEYNVSNAFNSSITPIINITVAYFTGILITPILLPYIPVRMFAFKGLILGAILTFALTFLNLIEPSLLTFITWLLLLPAISSFMAMNFTGGSTFTSLAGVKKEMKLFVPIQITMASFGIILFITNRLIN